MQLVQKGIGHQGFPCYLTLIDGDDDNLSEEEFW